jgi:hypothetical protein
MTQVAQPVAALREARQQKRAKRLDEYRTLLRDIAEGKIKRMPTAKLEELQTVLDFTDEEIDADMRAMQQVVGLEANVQKHRDELPRLEERDREIGAEFMANKQELARLEQRQHELRMQSNSVKSGLSKPSDLTKRRTQIERDHPRLFDPPPAPEPAAPPAAESTETPPSSAEPEVLGGPVATPVPGSGKVVELGQPVILDSPGVNAVEAQRPGPGPAHVDDYDPLG